MTGSQGDLHVETSPARRWALLLGLLAATAVLAGLGIWQVQRLHWKHDLIARVDARLKAEPVPAPGPDRWSAIDAAQDEYTRVRLAGTFLNDKEALVVASTERGSGYWVLTPFLQQDGSAVIVNRGFVPNDRRGSSARAAGQIEGATTVTGLLRITEGESWILRKNDPAADRWYRRDPAEIGRARGIGRVAPYFVDADATPNAGGWPLGGLTRVGFADNHLIYAITWFAMAAMAALAAAFVVRSEFRVPSVRKLGLACL